MLAQAEGDGGTGALIARIPNRVLSDGVYETGCYHGRHKTITTSIGGGLTLAKKKKQKGAQGAFLSDGR
ncbi:hypothetical protein BF17_08460 [Yersinia similis]|uniref:Uncharacterized protein n=1 Tax=Yersinia similis TaxID=367190 RepID=A0ABM5Q3L7_9GAMM|nr:hypothetical protein BF17_08460 [Yersinia similis]